METEVSDLINAMEQARNRLDTALDALPPRSEIYPAWQVKQLLDHITGWDELMTATLHAYQRGEIPGRSVRSINKYNDDSISARQVFTLDQSRQAYTAARQQVIQTLRAIPSEMFTQEFKAPWGGKCTIPEVMKIFISHELEHASHIEGINLGEAKTA